MAAAPLGPTGLSAHLHEKRRHKVGVGMRVQDGLDRHQVFGPCYRDELGEVTLLKLSPKLGLENFLGQKSVSFARAYGGLLMPELLEGDFLHVVRFLGQAILTAIGDPVSQLCCGVGAQVVGVDIRVGVESVDDF